MEEKHKNLIWQFREEFLKKIAEKTGWGKNEIKELLDDIIIKTLSEQV